MNILIKPIITEKATADSELHNRFSFVVHKKANKVEIRKAVEEAYQVHVEAVRTMIMPSKRKVRFTKGGVIEGGTGSYKKAVIDIRKGETIDLYSNI
ncbi:50S ribosomal protein L23 [bacterium]|nr:50S ribosomal protein L23 [bacterium]